MPRRAAEDLKYRVLVARPTESEASYSFAGLTDLLETATGLISSLPSPQRRALEIALLSAEDDSTYPADHRTLAMAVLSLIRLLSEKGPVIVAVDDVQWLDAPTLQVLEFIVRRLGDAPVGILLSLRTEEASRTPLACLRSSRTFGLRSSEWGRSALRPSNRSYPNAWSSR